MWGWGAINRGRQAAIDRAVREFAKAVSVPADVALASRHGAALDLPLQGAMSYDLRLRDPVTGTVAIVPDGHDLRGGTYPLGGTDEARFNITYNYSAIFRKVLGDRGIRVLYGLTGRASLPVLAAGIAQLADDDEDDYWAATEGNAKRALQACRLLARACPDAVWEGD